MAESNSTIARTILSELGNGKSMQELTSSLAAYLIEERRLGDLPVIMREIEKTILETKGLLYVHVTSARELEKSQAEQIKQMFKQNSGAKEVILETTINKGVIGGVRLQTASQQLDLSVRRQLQRLKQSTSPRA